MSNRGMYVEVYRNLHRKCLSVRHKGLVISYVDHIVLSDARLVVQPAGNARVRREKRKNVHAVVRGYISSSLFPEASVTPQNAVTYNPYLHTSFVGRITSEPIQKADMVLIDISKGIFVS